MDYLWELWWVLLHGWETPLEINTHTMCLSCSAPENEMRLKYQTSYTNNVRTTHASNFN